MSDFNDIDDNLKIENWKAQMRKGYLDLCLLLLIRKEKRIYGLEIIEILKNSLGLPVKEGTLYPLLNRLTADGYLKAEWVTENNSGHPRKFYVLTNRGANFILSMEEEFKKLILIFETLNNQ